MSEIINNNDSYIVRTNGRIYVKLGGRYIALIDEDGNLNVKLKTSISTVSNFNDINSEGLYYYNGNIYAYANGSPYLLTGGGGSGDVINQVLSGDLRAVTSNAVYVTTENIKNNLANKVLPFEEFKTISSVVYNPTDITEGRVLYSLNLKCFILENTVGGRTTYYTNWKGSEKYQTINSDNVSQITLKPDVLYLFTNLSVGQVSARTLYMAKSDGNLTRILTDRDLNDVLTLDDIDTEITSSSSKPVASSAIYTALSKLGSIEYFDGTLSAEETINIIDSATTSNDILILYSYKYKTFVAKYNNNYYKRWNTADKFFDGTTPNKHILFVCDDTLYFWNNDLVTVNVDNIDDCIIYVDLYMRGGLLPTPSASDLGKYAIVESNTYQLYRAEQFNNVISYTAKSFSKNRLYINDNKLYLWNGSELVQVGISEFNLLIAPFDGVINSATVQESSYTGTGDVFYITSLQRFAFRVISLNQTKYYDNWSDSGLYFGENRKPRKDTIYVNNGVGYVFDGTNGLIAIGGSTPSGPDTQQTVDQSLSTTSTNAIANKAVTTELNDLSGRVTTMEQSGVPSEVTADEVTVSAKNASGGNAAIHLASNLKSTVNSVGAIHVTDSVLPSNVSQNTKYIIYKDITTGNVDGLNYIQLVSGTKIVPNGGIAKVPVVGGELSWVHSSDIGMVQDDESLSASARRSRGEKNAEILRILAASRWNLILDGRYYVYIDSSANAIQLWRELYIQGGGLVAYRHLFSVMADRPMPDMTEAQLAALRRGGIICDNVEFIHETSFTMIRLLPSGGVLTKAIFRGCTFKGQGSFIFGESANIIPTDVTDIDIKLRFSTERCKTLLGLTENSSGKSRYYLDMNNGYSLYIAEAGAEGKKDKSSMLCLYDLRMLLYVPYSQGEYVFRISSSGALKHMGNNGDFVLLADTQLSDTLYLEDGVVVHYTTLSVSDSYENGVPVRNSNPSVEFQGVQRFIAENCSFLHDPEYEGLKSYGRDIYLDGLAVKDEYLIKGCRFENVMFEAINLATTNTIETRDEWGGRSCPLVVDNNVFRGYPNVVNGDDTTYYCAIAAEIGIIYFKNNLVERFIGRNPAVYDVYLSCAKVYYQNNLVRNVFPVFAPRNSQITSTTPITKDVSSGRLYGYMKSKLVKVGLRITTEESDHKDLTTKPFCRIFENNHFESDIKEVRKICESFLRKYQADFFSLPDLFPDGGYADVPYEEIPLWAIDKVLEKYVLHTDFPNLVTYWGLSEYTVRGNIFDMPGVRMHGGAVSGGCTYALKWNLENNFFRMKSFVSSRSGGCQYYLFAVGQLSDASTRVSLCGNTFISDNSEVINLLGLAEGYNLKSLRIEDNKFINCGWRVSQRPRSADVPTEYYEGPIRADEISILRNEEAPGLDEGWEFNPLTKNGLYFNGWTTSNTSVFGVLGVPHLYIGHGNIELWDSQKTGVQANAPKCILLPREGKLTLHSKHWCRPMPRYVGATADANPSAAAGTHIVTAANSSLLEITDITDAEAGVPVTLICGSTASGVHIAKSGKFAGITAEWSPAVGNRIRLVKDVDGNFTELGRWANTAALTVGAWANTLDNRALSLVHGLSANEPASYAVTVRYRLHGKWNEKKLELRSVAVSSKGRGVSARGIDGRRFCNVESTKTLKTWLLGGIEELGLWFLVSHKYLGDANDMRNYAAPTIRLDLFTDPHGTKNDIGTEITVETGIITNNADIPTSSTLNYGDTSLFETFVPKGSTLTAAERTALLTGDRVFWNEVPTEGGGRTYRTLRPVDAGWWCVDPDSGLKVIWNGTAWETDKKIVSLTQAEYNALTTKDENTLYLIVDA